MEDYTSMQELVDSFLDAARDYGFSDKTLEGFEGVYRKFVLFSIEHGESEFTEELAVDYLNHAYGLDVESLYQLPVPGGWSYKHSARCMRRLLEYKEYGCIFANMPGPAALSELPEGLQELLDAFSDAGRRDGYAEATVFWRRNHIRRFLSFLAENGGSDASCLDASSAHDYLLTKSGNRPKSIQSILSVIRCFYRCIYMEGLVERDLTGTVPKPKLYCAPELPALWGESDLRALLEGIDRSNPTGKRDYAMLLIVARLGLRTSDVKAIRISDFDWAQRRISIVQRKTGKPLELPLLDDVGWAVIDYLRGGRPESADCPELFVRHTVPYGPFAATANLNHILARRAREAGVDVAGGLGSMHGLRHALATRMLEHGVPLEGISRILGHADKRTTCIYLSMDAESLAKCALDPEEAGE